MGDSISNRHADIVRDIFLRGWSRGDFAGLEGILEGPFSYHIRGSSRQMGFDDLCGIVARWRNAFPDLRFEIDDLVASGGLVALRTRLLGTHEGRWGERDPTGNPIDVEHMFFLRFEGKRLVEVFELLDEDALRTQLDA